MASVKFLNIDVYEYFGRRLRIEHDHVTEMVAIDGIESIVMLFMRQGLPLAAAVIYVAYEIALSGKEGPRRLFSRDLLEAVSLPQKSRRLVPLSDAFGGDVIRQLARFFEYRSPSNTDGRGPKTVLESDVRYPHPFRIRSFDNISHWLRSEGFVSVSPIASFSWRNIVGLDYDSYLNHWCRANWEEFCSMLDDPILDEIVQLQSAALIDETATIWFEAESRWTRRTPNLTPGLRVSLLAILTSTKALKLVDVQH